MSFLEQYQLAIDPEFIARVEIALCKSSVAVNSEPPETVGHDVRVKYSKRVLDAPASAGAAAAVTVAAQPAINADSTDDDIEFTINACYDALAGVIHEAPAP